MARRVSAVAIGTGVLLFALRLVSGNPRGMSFVFALGVMVALVPEGLPATLSVSLAIGVRRMARRQALIKRLTAVEALGSTTVICKKTGTLTKAEMTVQQILASGPAHSVSGAGYSPVGEVADAVASRRACFAQRGCAVTRDYYPRRGVRAGGCSGTRPKGRSWSPQRRRAGPGGRSARTPRAGAFPSTRIAS